MSKKHILIVGTGSIGMRHGRNLTALGATVCGMDPRPDRRAAFAEEFDAATFEDLATALAGSTLDGVAVCSPTRFHVEQCLPALKEGLPVLLEKPVAKTLAEAEVLAEAIRRTDTPLLLGYTWRWWPPLARVRQLLAEKAVGTMRFVDFTMSAHLEDWHPGEPLEEFFMSSAELGGGALLDESHWVDLMLWFFGRPENLSARVEKISDLDITSDDNVDMMINFANGLRANLHLDLYGRPHRKSIRFIGDGGTILWSEAPNQIAICVEAGENWAEERFECERNDMFVGVAEEYLAVLNGAPVSTCGIDDGLGVMALLEAARQSHDTGRRIILD
ncbi:MAG: Gfo/Idh/MocA family oxidoreductase [Rhodospirillaceae bacterium]|jgi:predicted dehydrogenase|nr:Gfo/Idh/MocA family oxidoreductase [Rhodospirillaceae bacterium]MBT4490189.1 Gfo/Idh/MocA family oxidoreductase [Rhodospirillaceae bacterium]MBT5190893.1 Gfo/Idh/MocA family oxidoreductase [Rhodospirillaceae bacterium]MBT5898750.1 Gfo/Idh/MocA family oxidoreductase [Rhodospirillaceae bacterium]MBT6426562.1 Gfo/Idh/MocA family oxidoreductase [Rhodospirillaceae bacterium]